MTARHTIAERPDSIPASPTWNVRFDDLLAEVERVARDVDVMAGLGHASVLTPEGRARRRAADTLRALAVLLDATARERDDARRALAADRGAR